MQRQRKTVGVNFVIIGAIDLEVLAKQSRGRRLHLIRIGKRAQRVA